jgi:UDP-glucuronate 4-epimerase
MRVLVTGAAGFIGSALAIKLLDRGDVVLGIDNHNDYYDPALKEARLARHLNHPNYRHLRVDITDGMSMESAFAAHRPQCVVNLAAQAGVRYSIENPFAFVNSNITGFTRIIECCRRTGNCHLVYASSSSVYGGRSVLPFSVHQSADHPLSLYAASKRANELIAHAYSHLYGLATTGLRFFTVYGPWGRPDMALFNFTRSIISGEKVQVFNHGRHCRDFTYIDDIVEAILRVIDRPAMANDAWAGEDPDLATSSAPWRIYNVGAHRPVQLMDLISSLERSLGKRADLEFLPLQPGDVPDTYADMSEFADEFSYSPSTSVEVGVPNFVNWYREYYNIASETHENLASSEEPRI